MAAVFDGLRVVDLSLGVAGRITTMMLADNGADVVRVERDDPSVPRRVARDRGCGAGVQRMSTST